MVWLAKLKTKNQAQLQRVVLWNHRCVHTIPSWRAHCAKLKTKAKKPHTQQQQHNRVQSKQHHFQSWTFRWQLPIVYFVCELIVRKYQVLLLLFFLFRLFLFLNSKTKNHTVLFSLRLYIYCNSHNNPLAPNISTQRIGCYFSPSLFAVGFTRNNWVYALLKNWIWGQQQIKNK